MNSLKRQEPVVGPSVDNDQQLEIPRAQIDANLAVEEFKAHYAQGFLNEVADGAHSLVLAVRFPQADALTVRIAYLL